MLTSNQKKDPLSEKLISEYPFKEGLALYVDAWKELLWASVKAVVAVTIGLAAVQIVSAFVSVTAVVGLLASVLIFFKDLVFNHPFLSLVSVVVILLGMRTAYVKATTK